MANSCGEASSPNGTEGFHFQLRPCTVHNFTGKARDSGNEDSSPAGTPSTTAAMARRGFRQFMPLDQSGSSRAMEVERLGSSGLFGTRTRAYGSDEEPGRRRRRSSRTICARTPKGAGNRPVPLCRRNQKRRRQRISRSCCAGVLPNMGQTYHSLAHLARDSSAAFPVTPCFAHKWVPSTRN